MRPLLLAIAVVLAAGCGGGEPSPESVVRAWSEALNAGDDEAAAELFAEGAEIIQGPIRARLRTKADAVAFNQALPCSGTITAIETAEDSVTATFLLGDRPESACDDPGVEVRAFFRIQEGKIVVWHQLPTAAQPEAPSA